MAKKNRKNKKKRALVFWDLENFVCMTLHLNRGVLKGGEDKYQNI